MSQTLYNILEWITRFAYINILWVFFTLVGGVIFGLIPSTTALFAVIRQWLKGNSNTPVFKSFWAYYKSDFLKSNRLAIFIYICTIIIGYNLIFLQAQLDHTITWTSVPLLAGMLLFLLVLFYIFPVFAHYDVKVTKVIKNAFLTMLVSPIHTFLMIICLVSFYVIVTFIPALFFIFGASFYAFITMWTALQAFHKIDKRAGN
ncbi:putative membrane protein YesL [Virgibacillus natechei]|uniref:Membrane protein YesL n=1 Tax=Virgibacillus natechei TaxID=1216297 RepID=A0ABS4IED1_9BACI|nr:DUF624 domain-containing protein [Virgibacillus natechei]MBP1969307.1 putative membrane protein YesL [Virgibacillus natechei]UZD12460.1 DUF624 domain-containing protein [Virgibacillus natechei]